MDNFDVNSKEFGIQLLEAMLSKGKQQLEVCYQCKYIEDHSDDFYKKFIDISKALDKMSTDDQSSLLKCHIAIMKKTFELHDKYFKDDDK